MKKTLHRVYIPYDKWEEVEHNMWGESADKQKDLAVAIELTGNAPLYGSYMWRVITEWPNSCVNALTDSSLNRRAWLGHAACALAHRLPEYIVREAWGYLTDEQRLLANREAERAIQLWEGRHYEDSGLHTDMGKQMLFEWSAG